LLAKILLSDPDLVILDEPTNHLDIAAVEWLENYLREWEGAALIVSHDRYFLDRVINVVWEMTPMGFESYRGNYTAYVQTREDRWQRRQDLFTAEIQRMENELDYVRRNIAGQRTTQAQGKLRRLSRQIEAVEKGGFLAVYGKKWGQISDELDIRGGRMMRVDEAGQRLKSLRIPSRNFPDLNLNLKAAQRSGDLVLRTYDLEIGYPDAPGPLFSVPDLIFRRGECAAVIGPNGAGKTTFLKTILGQLPPLAGELDLGASLEVGYFAQAHEELDPSLTLVEEIEQVAPKMLLAEIRKYLARFLFQGDEVFKQVAVLSGGERGRLALAKLALSDANLLMLDEPTNHLDIPSQEILQAVLANFNGTILLVSHDRYLIDALGTQIWEIEPKQTALIVFGGSYTAYRAEKESRSGPVRAQTDPRAVERAARRRRANLTGKQAKQRQARLAEVEGEITALETRLEKLARKLENPPPDVDKVQKLGARYLEIQTQLDDLLSEWEDLAAEQ
jgi:ATP-binding cassette subfamily F protein 3